MNRKSQSVPDDRIMPSVQICAEDSYRQITTKFRKFYCILKKIWYNYTIKAVC